MLRSVSLPVPWRAVAMWRGTGFLGAVVAVLFALAARLPYFVHTDFPLNDGGMFLAMSEDIINAHYSLPVFTSYNSQNIPFAYPPLSFYMVAVTSGLIHVEPITLVRYLPLVANLATVVAVGLLARSLFGNGWAALIAPIIFSVLPRSYEWMIMGGGLTRSVGFMFAVLAMWQAVELYKDLSMRRVLLTALLAAATLMSHLELGIFMVYSLVGLAVLRSRSLHAILLSVAVIGFAIVFAAPWWGTVVIRHGLAPFDAASLTGYWSTFGQSIDAFQAYTFPSGFLMSSLGVAAALGALVSFLRGEFFLPLWLPAVFLWVPRSAQSEATVPLALLAATGLADVMVLGLAQTISRMRGPAIPALATSIVHRPMGLTFASRAMEAGGLLLLLAATYIYSPQMHGDPSILDSLSDGDRQAMAWVAANTPASARFMVLSSAGAWENDNVAEWFPVLAQRRSVITPQGTEWLPNEAFTRWVCVSNSARVLGSNGNNSDYLDEWARDRGLSYSYIYISKASRGPVDWSRLEKSALSTTSYKLVLDNGSAVVLEREEPVKPFAAPPGQVIVSRDCQSLADQPVSVQQSYLSTYGDNAAWEWVTQRDLSVPAPQTICDKIDGTVVGQISALNAVCRREPVVAATAMRGR